MTPFLDIIHLDTFDYKTLLLLLILIICEWIYLKRSIMGESCARLGDRWMYHWPTKCMEQVMSKTGKVFSKLFDLFHKTWTKLPNHELFFCGFSLVLIPLIIVYWLICLCFFLIELLVFLAVSLVLGLIYILIGIWPAFFLTLGVTCIAVVRIPWNIYYHCLITYRTVMLRPNLKMISFILLPLAHLLVPLVVFAGTLAWSFGWFLAISFAGYPFRSWEKLGYFLGKFWDKAVNGVGRFVANYGHPTGIPHNWDGTMYGMIVDPVSVIISVLLYIYAVVPTSLGVFLIWTIKAIPIFLGTILECCKALDITKALRWYQRVLFGVREEPRTDTARRSERPYENPSGHQVWSKKLKKSTKGLVKGIENYQKINIFKKSYSIMKTYGGWAKKLNPEKLLKMATEYMTLLSKIFPKDLGCKLIIVIIPLILTIIMWLLGLLLVLTIPPLSFLLAFITWIVCWVFVIAIPPILYIFGWILIIFGIPLLYILVWVLVLIGPWIFVAGGMFSGPFIALQIPFANIKKMYNPVEMWSSIKKSLVKPYYIILSVDRFTSKFSLKKVKLFNSDDPSVKPTTTSMRDYWDLYIGSCIEVTREILAKGWLTEDDVLSASSTTMIAVPGVAILDILVNSVKQHKKKSDKTLIYWSQEDQCTDATRNKKDNVANLFWPKLMLLKESLMNTKQQDILDKTTEWIKASLCDGEDTQSDELKKSLDDHGLTNEQMKICLRIRAQIENIVHSLLRVGEMNRKMHLIFEADYNSNPK